RLFIKLPVETGEISGEHGSGVLRMLKPVAEIAAIFGSLAFVAGWSHFTSYYYTFGLNPLELDLPVAFTSAFSLHVLYRSAVPILLLAVAAGILVLLRRFFAAKPVSMERAAPMLLFLILVLLGFLGNRSGARRARSDLFEESSTLPSVGFFTDL